MRRRVDSPFQWRDQVQLEETLRVGDQVDRSDLRADGCEREQHSDLPVRRPCNGSFAVDKRRHCTACAPAESATAIAPRVSACAPNSTVVRSARRTTSGSSTARSRSKSPYARRPGMLRRDSLAVPDWLPDHRPASALARERGSRVSAPRRSFRPTIGAISSNGMPKMSCRTNATRSEAKAYSA